MSVKECLGVGMMLALAVSIIGWVGTSGIDWPHALLMSISMGAIGYASQSSKRLKSAKRLPIGEFTLAVRGERWLPYQVIYQGEQEVVWQWGDVVQDDVWKEFGYRSTEQMPTFDIVLWDKLGNLHPLKFILHEIIRSDEPLAVIVGKNKGLEALNFRLLVDIGRETVRLIVFPALPPSKEGAMGCESGTPIWIGKRHPDGAWEIKAS